MSRGLTKTGMVKRFGTMLEGMAKTQTKECFPSLMLIEKRSLGFYRRGGVRLALYVVGTVLTATGGQ